MWEGIEKCLITARRQGGHDERIVPLLFGCAVEPYFLGHSDNLLHLGCLAEVLEEFGWEHAEELVCNLSAKILGRGRGTPDHMRRSAIQKLEPISEWIDGMAADSTEPAGTFDEGGFAEGLVSGDLDGTFDAVTHALKAGVDIQRIVTEMVLVAADRMARTPVNMNPGWGGLAREMALASSVRTALRYGGFQVAAKALYHAAWQFFDDRWLNISPRPIAGARGAETAAGIGEEAGVEGILEGIETIQVRQIGRRVREYLNAGFSGDRLLARVGQTILRDDNAWNILHALRTVFEEWALCEGHPARGQLLVGLSRWATDVRRRKGSQSAAQTAQRFASGMTAVDLYEA